ncbi:hypothetical protein NHJ6243_008934 [Beauveria neobassiana]
MSWKIWTKVTFTLGWLESNDVLTKLKVLFNLACLVGSFNEDAAHNTQRPARRAFYLATRYAMAVHFFIYYVLLLMDARLPCSWMRGFHARLGALDRAASAST